MHKISELRPTLSRVTSADYLQVIEDRVATEIGDRTLTILSDYDGTLATDDGVTHEAVAAARGLSLIVATARLANNPQLIGFWESGLMSSDKPIIIENGGALAFFGSDGLKFRDLVSPQVRDKFVDLHGRVQAQRDRLPLRQDTQIVLGRTMFNLIGATDPTNLDVVVMELTTIIDDPSVRIVDAGSTIAVYDDAISKPSGFRAYLDGVGLSREDVYVVGMGDAPNDAETLAEADLSLAFGKKVAHLADIEVIDGVYAASAVLEAICRGAQRK